MMKFRENEDAVSPVIGVILMVAITVILAAVIAAFVFGMGSNIETQKQVVISAKQITDGKLQVTVQSGADLSNLKYLRIEVTTDNTAASPAPSNMYYTKDGGTLATGTVLTDATTKISVGSTYTTSGAALSSGSDHVVIVGAFADGKEQMLVDTTL